MTDETARHIRMAEAILRHAEDLRDQAETLVEAGRQLVADALEEREGTVTPIRPDDDLQGERHDRLPDGYNDER
jgi:hypothetical protein